MKKVLAFWFSFLVCSVASAAATSIKLGDFRNAASTSNTYNLLNAVALNASAATRTITLDTVGWAKLRVFVFFTRTAATSVTAEATCSRDGTNYARITSRAIAGGAGTLGLFTETLPTSVSVNFMLEYDIAGCTKVKVLFGGASAGGSDLVNVQAVAIAGS